MNSTIRKRLYDATITKNVDSVRRMINAGIVVNVHITGDKQTPLHYAVFNADFPMIRLLLEYGADVTMKDSRGRSPLHYACTGYMVHISDSYELLLEEGADCNDKNLDGITPFHFVVETGA